MAEVLVEVYLITGYREWDVFKTRYLEDRWVPHEERDKAPGGYLYVPKPNTYKGRTIRPSTHHRL